MLTLPLRIARGRCLPLGASAQPDGVNFALLCRHGTAVFLVVYALDGTEPIAEIALHPRRNRTGDHWHVLVAGLPPAFAYGWRVDGPRSPGHCYDPNNVLLDPAATALSNGARWGMSREPEKHRSARRSVYIRRPFHWQEDAPLLTPLEDTIIYELHVRGFTCHPSSLAAHPGTFAGLIEKIPYLQSLGVTAVELLPIHEFDENGLSVHQSDQRRTQLRNFWGYNSIAFGAPKAAYAGTGAGARPDHRVPRDGAGLPRGRHRSLSSTWSSTTPARATTAAAPTPSAAWTTSSTTCSAPDGRYLNFSGCGNTVNCNHPVVRQLLMNCLRFWVADMHVDGLRFDLASVMGRDSHGNVLIEPPVVEMIAEDGVLSRHQADRRAVGRRRPVSGRPFPVRPALVGVERPLPRRRAPLLARRPRHGRRPGDAAVRQLRPVPSQPAAGRIHSINFITCHDGFTLWDLVSYNQKHNEANGEDNRDGSDDNWSWNCGVEGRPTDPNILGLRRRQARNLMATLFLSQGVPMLLAGDEFLRTQHGNNNAWCQDNEISWLDWSLAVKNGDFLRFVRELIALRQAASGAAPPPLLRRPGSRLARRRAVQAGLLVRTAIAWR